MAKNLKSKKYYEDIYDKMTVDHCRRKMQIFKDLHIQLSKKQKNKFPQKTIDRISSTFFNVTMHFEKAYCFKDKEKTVLEMMEKDKLKDERIKNTKAPLVNCLKCNSDLAPSNVDISLNDKILFIYDCPNRCIPRRAFYEDGEEYIIKDKKCPECNGEIETETDNNSGDLVITEKCLNCGYTEKFDYSSKKEPEDPNYEKDKKEFCLNEEDGKKSIEDIHQLDRVAKLGKKFKEREEKKDLYDAIKNLPKLSIHDLKTRLDKLFQDNNYSDLIFAQPEMSTDVQVTFTAHDIKTDREEYDSRQGLKNLIKKELLDTNWRLMSDGIEYRMGILKGRLRGFDRERDLLKLEQQKIKDREKKKR